MANFIKAHGLKLANNGFIENAHFERLAADPVPVGPGRVWYNDTQKKLKFSSLDDVGAVVIRTVADNEDLVANYLNINGTTVMTGNLDMGSKKITNVADGVADTDAANIKQVKDAVSGLGSVFDLKGTLDPVTQSDLDAIVTPETGDVYKVTAPGTFTYNAGVDSIIAATNDMIAKTTTGWMKIDNTEATVSGTTDRITVTGTVDTGFTIDISTTFRTTVDNLGTEVNDIETAVGLNADGSYTPYTAYDKDANPTGAMFISTATSVKDSTMILDTNLRLVKAQVDGKIGDLNDLTTTNKSTLVAAINEVAETAAEGSSDLAQAIDAKNFTTTTTVAALTHTITHGLNTDQFVFNVMVADDLGVFRNDIVPVSIVDANNVLVELSEARNIKVNMISLKAVYVAPVGP